VLDDLTRAGIDEVVAVLPSDNSCVLFYVDEKGVRV
jgi:hypothetical protein